MSSAGCCVDAGYRESVHGLTDLCNLDLCMT